jgi:hypothetical protein
MHLSTLLLASALPLVLVLASCNLPLPAAATSPVTAQATLAQPAEGQLQAAPHRIGIIQADGKGRFFDRSTNTPFVVRGVNYVFVPDGNTYTPLLLKVGVYDPQRTRADFAALAGLGYNTVRVFLDHCGEGAGCIGDNDNSGLNPEYLDNVADMTSAAKQAGVYLLFTSDDLPDQGGYAEEANAGSGGIFAGYRNSYYLRPNAISATRRYWRDLLIGLKERNAAMDAVLAWQLLNEQFMFRNEPPLSLDSGQVETTTGVYDMGDPAQKTQMVSDGLVYYIAQMKDEILLHDPTALVTMGFIVPEIVAPERYIETTSLLQRADLDFFDFHGYPGGPSLRAHAEHFGMVGYDAKPIILGEYGAFRHLYPSIEGASAALTEWVHESCRYGYDGWLYWTYYAADMSAGDTTWGFVDQGNYLMELLSPATQPEACADAQGLGENLAYNKPVTASQSLPDQPASLAVDDDSATLWSSGGDPTQWIQVDLQGSYRISEIRLLVAQFPGGNSTHLVQVLGQNSADFQTIHTFQGLTNDNDWLVFTPASPLENVARIRIQSMAGTSWVAWKEIRIYARAAP